MPTRFRGWHAPRANRWERIAAVAGCVAVEWLTLGAITTTRLARGDQRWVAPGTRWRVAALDADACFDFATYADETRAADAAQPARVALLQSLPTLRLGPGTEPSTALAALEPGKPLLLRADTASGARLANAMRAGAGAYAWHPLAQDADGGAALVARSNRPDKLADYMGRDHAVIEAALAGTLAGDAECARWLPRVLARHLAIEEQALFPAYLAAGGRGEWIDGLLREHRDLREHLPRLADPTSRRRFLLMLDGHDEKEEQLIYPDIMARAGGQSAGLAIRCATWPLVV
ncbi:MAG TPA: hemerythrin domain-containing protein [Rhodanobacteraceae bacterium]